MDWEGAKPWRHLRHLPAPLDPTALAQALELIRQAKRPIILAGHGIQLSGARAEVLALAERADIPFALTLLGLGAVPATHPLSLGMMGMHGEAWVNRAI
jgi:acetolactate synthase-1/2/3 large subunit